MTRFERGVYCVKLVARSWGDVLGLFAPTWPGVKLFAKIVAALVMLCTIYILVPGWIAKETFPPDQAHYLDYRAFLFLFIVGIEVLATKFGIQVYFKCQELEAADNG